MAAWLSWLTEKRREVAMALIEAHRDKQKWRYEKSGIKRRSSSKSAIKNNEAEKAQGRTAVLKKRCEQKGVIAKSSRRGVKMQKVLAKTSIRKNRLSKS